MEENFAFLAAFSCVIMGGTIDGIRDDISGIDKEINMKVRKGAGV